MKIMEEKIIKCDICQCILQIGGDKVKDTFGITWTFGYSKGGWGSRENKPSFTGEVCRECYESWDSLVQKFNKEMLHNRIGINRQSVEIVK